MAVNTHAYDFLIAASAAANGLSVALLRAVIQHESAWEPLAVGDNGAALGLMQVHEIAAKDVGMEGDWSDLKVAIEAKDGIEAARISIKIGSAYLAKMVKAYGGQEQWALAAYNQGPTVINAFRQGQRYAEAVLALKGTA